MKKKKDKENKEEERRRRRNRGTELKNKMAINIYLSIITLDVNCLNIPIKRHRVAEWIRKQDPYIHCVQETHLKMKVTHRLKVKR